MSALSRRSEPLRRTVIECPGIDGDWGPDDANECRGCGASLDTDADAGPNGNDGLCYGCMSEREAEERWERESDR